MPNETFAYDEVRSSADAAEIKNRPTGDVAEVVPAVAYDQLTSPADAADIKRNALALNASEFWRADLWANVPQAINWANTDPITPPASIIFNIRDNGQVWTYTFISSVLPGAVGSWRANLWGNVPSAIDYANHFPLSEPGRIVFNIRDNGQVWTYDFG